MAARASVFYASSVDEGELDGIDVGDLPEALERIASEQETDARRLDDDLPLRPVSDGWCSHSRANINEGMRRLTCRECGADLDPFTWLVKMSRNAERHITTRKEAERRAREAQGRLEEILRLERNARARLNRLERKETP